MAAVCDRLHSCLEGEDQQPFVTRRDALYNQRSQRKAFVPANERAENVAARLHHMIILCCRLESIRDREDRREGDTTLASTTNALARCSVFVALLLVTREKLIYQVFTNLSFSQIIGTVCMYLIRILLTEQQRRGQHTV
jgi:hypothetical protein